ncbi:hypothetical protein [Mycobacterium sp. SP-6446]|uniref:hypothetical protein n=1 Tax=Mycobacterium sp. SP-6446 TaxID=1834162 RepID=UPI00096FCA2A|nr:hypothetical protein [Mycobacterium sp. SP-6446]OMC08434.1 hypothetical protein A5736_06530 [Mycobacterium sp. SP-6446]
MIQVDGWTLRPVEGDATGLAQLPVQWRPIAEDVDPAGRRAAALALWPAGFLDLAPAFAQRFTDHLTDVRACLAEPESEPVLVYLADPAMWIGRDPRTFITASSFWKHLPRPAQDFQRQTHSALTMPDRESYGLMHPAHMRTIAELARRPAGIRGWDEAAAARPGGQIASNRLLTVTRDSGNLWLCVSPDLLDGQAATVYEGDVDIDSFTSAFDDLMVLAFEDT